MNKHREKPNLISIVSPVFNERENIKRFVDSISEALSDFSLEVILVDDGSSDGTSDEIRKVQKKYPFVRLVKLSRNFGKEVALSAGLDRADGDVVVTMDGDLQHPAELIIEFVQKWREGYKIVYAVRKNRDEESVIKRVSTRVFYGIISKISDVAIPPDASDFRLFDKEVVITLRRFEERNRFMKGLFSWVGYQSIGVEYTPETRVHGSSAWGFVRLFRFAVDGIVGFSSTPLRVWSVIGLIFAIISFLYALYLITITIVYGIDVPGYVTLMVAIIFFGGVQLLSLGIIGEYVSRIYSEVRQRPLYVVEKQDEDKTDYSEPTK